MRYCEKCHVQVNGSQTHCPLCQGPLKGEPSPSPFPNIPTLYKRYGLLLKSALFASVTAVIICFTINWIFPQEIWWSLLVAAGIISMWAALITAIKKRSNFYKNVLWQLFLFTILSLLWDYFTGWHGWAIDYVFPFLGIFSLAAMPIAARIQNRRIQDYLNYYILTIIFALIPLIFLLTGILHTVYPSILCLAADAVAIAAILIFNWKPLWEELCKRTHF